MQKNFLRSSTALIVYMTILALAGCNGGSSYNGGGGSTSGGGGGTGGGTGGGGGSTGGGGGTGGGGTGTGTGGGTTTTYLIEGSLTGLTAGQSVSIQNNGGDTLNLKADGTFAFPTALATGAAYAVTVQSHSPGISCSVTSGSGTVGSANVMGTGVACNPGTARVLYSFGATANDATYPNESIVMDKNGNIFGTSRAGGANAQGAAFKIAANGTETLLYSFGATATDGSEVDSGPIFDPLTPADLIGAASGGGLHGEGDIFEINAAGQPSTLYSFGATGTDGITPQATPIADSAGNIYGTTRGGGANNQGIVFKIDTAGHETVLYSFGATANDAVAPTTSLITDSAGNFYGTTGAGGAANLGTVYKIDTKGKETVLHSFGSGSNDGQTPAGTVVMDGSGNLYGGTTAGGANGKGTIYKIDISGNESVLYSFGASASDGIQPVGNLLLDSAGNLYGYTYQGGASNVGTVFMVDPSGKETVLHSFGASASDGQFPFAGGGLILDSAANLYGVTYGGGANNVGAVFVLN